MQIPRTVSFYVAREILVYTLLGLVAVSFVFIGHNLVRRLADFLMIGVSAGDVWTIVRSVVVVSLVYTVPIAFLFGALVGVARLAADTEILAMRTCGLGLRHLVAPAFALGVLVSGLTWFLSLDVEHRAKQQIRDTLLAMTAEGELVRPGRFRQLGERMVFVEARDRENRLERVFIADHSDPARPLLIFAESGDIHFDLETREVRVRLRDGDLHVRGEGGSYNLMSFADFDYTFPVDLPTSLDVGLMRPRDMSTEDLRAIIERARSGRFIGRYFERRVEAYEVQLHRRYALPVAPMLFALVAVPISLRRTRGARSWGVLFCGLLVGCYYGILAFSEVLAVERGVPAALALWLPNVALALAAAGLLAHSVRVGR